MRHLRTHQEMARRAVRAGRSRDGCILMYRMRYISKNSTCVQDPRFAFHNDGVRCAKRCLCIVSCRRVAGRAARTRSENAAARR